MEERRRYPHQSFFWLSFRRVNSAFSSSSPCVDLHLFFELFLLWITRPRKMAKTSNIDYVCMVVPVKEFGNDRPWEIHFVSTFWTNWKGRRCITVRADPSDFTFTHQDVLHNSRTVENFLRTDEELSSPAATTAASAAASAAASTSAVADHQREILKLPLRDIEINFKETVYYELFNVNNDGWDVTFGVMDDYSLKFLKDQDVPEVEKIQPLPLPRRFLLTAGMASMLCDQNSKQNESVFRSSN